MESLVIRVQHYAGRDEPLKRLLSQLPPAVEVVVDSGETLNPWRGYRRCLEQLPDQGHVCILQDDVVVCRNFEPALRLIAAANPTTPVSLFLSKLPKRTYNLASLKYGKTRYVTVHHSDLLHVVGILWPVEKAQAFYTWAEENPKRLAKGREALSDDAAVTRWMKLTGQYVLCTVPSLVEHPDDVASVVNKRKMSNGTDAGRTAAYWIGGEDPLGLDWSR